MLLTMELETQLNSFLTGSLSLASYREAMMRVRLSGLDALTPRDKTFLLEFETRYAQLKADAITEYQFKQLLSYAAACEPAATEVPAEVWFHQKPAASLQKSQLGTGIPTANFSAAFATY